MRFETWDLRFAIYDLRLGVQCRTLCTLLENMPEACDVPVGAINTIQATKERSVVKNGRDWSSISEICDIT